MKPPKPPKRPTLRWDQYKRQVLCCLFRFFVRNNKQIEQIFSYIFRAHLRGRGIRDFVPFRTLNTQWVWMRNTGSLDWSHVHIETAFETDGNWQEILTTIKSAAQTLKLRLREKAVDNIDTSRWKSRDIFKNREQIPSNTLTTPAPLPRFTSSLFLTRQTRQSLNSIESSLPDNIRDQFEVVGECFGGDATTNQQDDPQDDPQDGPQDGPQDSPQRSLHDCDEPVVTSHGKCCLWCYYEATMGSPTDDELHEYHEDDIEDPDNDHHDDLNDQDTTPDLGALPTDQIPPLLYRWYDSDSQGVNSHKRIQSGMFTSGNFLSRDEITDQEFKQYFRHHVKPEKILTPFVSTFRSPLAPLQRALGSPKKGAAVTVIDTRKLQSKVFYAHAIAKHAGGFTFCWRGYGEYLIWGQVPAEAIVFTINVSTLETIVLSHRDINRLLQLSVLRTASRCDRNLRNRLAEKRKSPYKSGRTFGKLLSLLRFPTLYWEHAAHWFARCWGWVSSKEIVEFVRGLRSEIPYLSEELSDSESEDCLITPEQTPKKLRYIGELPSPSGNEGYLVTPLQTPQKLGTFVKLPLPSSVSSDIDYEPPESEENSEYSSEEEAAVNLEMVSVSMENKTETIDDEVFSTHESMSSFGSSPLRRDNHAGFKMKLFADVPRNPGPALHHEVLSNDFSDQRNLQCRYSSNSNSEMCVNPLCPISVVIPSRVQDRQPFTGPTREEEMSDVLILEDGSWTGV